MVLITVAVCTRNRAEFLDRCITSIIDQKVDRSLFEVLIVDNNSSDNTAKISNVYCEKHDNVRYVLEPEEGHSQARNRAVEESKGEFISFIDDDAYASNEWLESILFCFQNNGADIVGGPVEALYNVSDEISEFVRKNNEFKDFGPKIRKLEWPENRCGFPTVNSSYRKSLFEKHGNFSLKFGMVKGKLVMGEDSELNLRLSLAGSSFWFAPKAKVFHTTHGGVKTMPGVFKIKWASGFGMGKIYFLHFSFFKFFKRIPMIFYHFILFLMLLPFVSKREKSLDNLGFAVYDAAVVVSWVRSLFG